MTFRCVIGPFGEFNMYVCARAFNHMLNNDLKLSYCHDNGRYHRIPIGVAVG